MTEQAGDEFKKFDSVMSKVISVSREEFLKRERKYKNSEP